MRQAFVHTAVVAMAVDGDERAPGAAVTVALCGHWEHQPPCPLAPHHTTAVRTGDTGHEVRLRVLFAAEPAAEADVRNRIDAALAKDGLDGPDGAVARWRFRGARPGVVREDEAAHADRLVHG